MQHWLQRYGLAFLILLALACSSYLAACAEVPHPVPDFALQAPEIYRLEIGAAFFVAFYLATMAVVLALDGKGFTEFGTRGLKARTVVTQQNYVSHQEEINRQILKRMRSQEQRLARLESRR